MKLHNKSQQQQPIIKFQDVTTELKQCLETHGYCRVQTGEPSRKKLIEVAQLLGLCQDHARGDSDGIAEVSDKPFHLKGEIINQSEYLDIGTGAHGLHTDGSYIEGIGQTPEGGQIRVRRSKFVCMQMVQPAAEGGASLILDIQLVLEDLLMNDPSIFKILSQPCVVYCRDDHQSAVSPVFERIFPNAWSIRYRYDHTTLVQQSALRAIEYFHQKYISCSQYQQRFRLEVGEILIVDNLRVLHGRESFRDDSKKPRLLRRLWVADEEVSFVNPLRKPQHQQAYQHYQPYLSLPREHNEPIIPVKAGIRLKPQSQASAEQLFVQAFLGA